MSKREKYPIAIRTKEGLVMPAEHPRILTWDIESTNLNASFGTILCIGWKWHGLSEVHTLTILDGPHKIMLDDKWLVSEFAKVFSEADYHITWYGARFDLPFINTKLMKYELPPLPEVYHLDLWRHARYRMKLHSNRLQAVSEYLGVEHRKNPISFDDWQHAAHGNVKAMKQVALHCKLDVLVLEEVFDRMRPWLPNEPSRILFVEQPEEDGKKLCPSCGSDWLRSSGFRVGRTYRYRRYQCQKCGKWSRERTSDKTPGRRSELAGPG